MKKSGTAEEQISAREPHEHPDRRFGSCNRAIALGSSQPGSNEPGRDRTCSNNFCTAGERANQSSSTLLGFTKETSAGQKDWEKKFRDGIVPRNIRENMRRLSARPHHVGSPYDKDNAEWILSRFKDAGFDATIETFNVLFPTPKRACWSWRAESLSRNCRASAAGDPPRSRPANSCLLTTLN